MNAMDKIRPANSVMTMVYSEWKSSIECISSIFISTHSSATLLPFESKSVFTPV